MKKYFFTAVVPISLFFIGIFLTLLEVYRNEGNFFSIQTAILKSDIQYPKNQLIKGDIVRGTFRAQYDNLGVVGVRFVTHFRINEDSLIFRIRNIEDPEWAYQSIYKTDQFQPDQLFPFGFPVIRESRNKSYIFEIESVDGTVGNGVSINTHFPIAVASYVLDKNYYLSAFGSIKNKYDKTSPAAAKDTALFIVNKTYAIPDSGQYTDIFLLYMSPIPVYLFWYWVMGTLSPKALKFISNHKLISFVSIVLVLSRLFIFKTNASFYTFLIFSSWVTGTILYRSSRNSQTRNYIVRHRFLILVIPILIIIKILLVTKNQDNITMGITLLWFSSIVIYKINNVINFYLSLVFLALSALSYYTGQTHIAELTAAWAIVAFGFTIVNELITTIRTVFKSHA